MERTEIAEIEAQRSLFRAVPADVAEKLGVRLLELEETIATQVRLRPQSTEVNHAFVAGADELDAVAEFYGGSRHAVSPASGVDLDAELRRRGYEPGYAWMKFARELDDLPTAPTDPVIVAVEPGRGGDFGRVVVEGFGMPQRFADWLAELPGREGWHCFVAYDGDEPAGGGALFVHEDLGWLGIAATLPAKRGRGAQSAILAARVRRAAELGCTLVVTETGELVEDRPSSSYRNILRAGFEAQYLRANYVAVAVTPQ